MKPHLVYSRLDEHIVVVMHDDHPPREDEWEAFCRDLHAWSSASPRLLVLTDGGAPIAWQRARLRETAGLDRADRIAVVTRSPLARGTAAVLCWFHDGIRSFRPEQMLRAFDYLELSDEQRRSMARTLGRLRAALDGTSAPFQPISRPPGCPPQTPGVRCSARARVR